MRAGDCGERSHTVSSPTTSRQLQQANRAWNRWGQGVCRIYWNWLTTIFRNKGRRPNRERKLELSGKTGCFSPLGNTGISKNLWETEKHRLWLVLPFLPRTYVHYLVFWGKHIVKKFKSIKLLLIVLLSRDLIAFYDSVISTLIFVIW